jgi:hypothetical protein
MGLPKLATSITVLCAIKCSISYKMCKAQKVQNTAIYSTFHPCMDVFLSGAFVTPTAFQTILCA